MLALELVKLTALLERSSGSPDIKIGLIDGLVVTKHAELRTERLHELRGRTGRLHSGQ